jgi:hypothetical protein
MRKYGAQSQAVPLIAWLNDARKNGEQSYRRLSKLYDLLLRSYELALVFKKSAREIQEADLRFITIAEKLRVEVNRVLRFYKLRPYIRELRLGEQRLFIGWYAQRGTFEALIPDEVIPGFRHRFGESDAVMRLIELFQTRFLERVRKCEQCGTWFYSIRTDGRFCRQVCGQQHFRSRPDSKERRKLYMRKLRKDHVEMDQRSKHAARRILRQRNG